MLGRTLAIAPKDRTGPRITARPDPRERTVMPYPSVLLAAAQETARDGGPGWILRAVIIVGFVGGGLLAWFLLRGYGQD